MENSAAGDADTGCQYRHTNVSEPITGYVNMMPAKKVPLQRLNFPIKNRDE